MTVMGPCIFVQATAASTFEVIDREYTIPGISRVHNSVLRFMNEREVNLPVGAREESWLVPSAASDKYLIKDEGRLEVGV